MKMRPNKIEDEQKGLIKILTEHNLQSVKAVALELKEKESQIVELSVGEKDLETEIEESKTGLVEANTIAKIYKDFY